MSTRSLIAQQAEDGSIRSIYCHFDGYPDHHAPILIEHYTTPELVTALIDLGDLSSLAEKIGEYHDFDERPRTHDDWCMAYGRDRGEDGTEANSYASEADWRVTFKESWAQYFYLYCDQSWLIWQRDIGQWVALVVPA